MLPPTPKEKESIIQLLLSSHSKNVQVALNLLESQPNWRAPLKKALEVFYFFDSRRYYGPFVFELKAPLIEFTNQEEEVRDAHQLVGEWLEELEEGFDGPLHPLFWLGSPDLLFKEEVINEELDIKELVPSFALPELTFMEQQWAYYTYLDVHPDWWLVARGWASFIMMHLEDKETVAQLNPKELEIYSNIAWQYYQKVLPLITEEYYYYHQAALFLQNHAPTTVAKEERKQLIVYYYEEALSFLTKAQEKTSDLVANYLLFTYKELKDSAQTFRLFQRFASDLLSEKELAKLQLDCQQLDKGKIIQHWINFIKKKDFLLVSKELEGLMESLYTDIIADKKQGTPNTIEDVDDLLSSLEDLLKE